MRRRKRVCSRPARFHAEQVHQSRIDAAQAERGVGNDGKQCHHGGADGQGHLRVLDQDDDQRRNRHDRRHLQQNRVRKEALLDRAALHEHEGDQHADDDSRDERLQCNAQRHPQRREQGRPVAGKLQGDVAWFREQKDRDVRASAQDLPEHDDDQPHRQRRGDRHCGFGLRKRTHGTISRHDLFVSAAFAATTLRSATPTARGNIRRSAGHCGNFRRADAARRSS